MLTSPRGWKELPSSGHAGLGIWPVLSTDSRAGCIAGCIALGVSALDVSVPGVSVPDVSGLDVSGLDVSVSGVSADVSGLDVSVPGCIRAWMYRGLDISDS